MSSMDYLAVILLLFSLVILSVPLGRFYAKVFKKEILFIEKIQSMFSKILNINFEEEMTIKEYSFAVLGFNFVGFVFVFVFAILMLQHLLPLNPEKLGSVQWALAFNTAVSFVTNTNWQAYAGEATMSYFSQMVALATQNFLSAATGVAVLLVLVRALMRSETNKIGNFWDDLIRSTLYILMPFAIVFAIYLIKDGSIQNFHPYVKAITMEGKAQVIPMGPVASQEAIKMLGTNVESSLIRLQEYIFLRQFQIQF